MSWWLSHWNCWSGGFLARVRWNHFSSSLNEPNLESHYFPVNFPPISSVVSPYALSNWLDFLHITLFRLSVPVRKYERWQVTKMRIYEPHGTTLSALLLFYWIYVEITYGVEFCPWIFFPLIRNAETPKGYWFDHILHFNNVENSCMNITFCCCHTFFL